MTDHSVVCNFPFSSKWGGWEITEAGEAEPGLEETCSAHPLATGLGKGLEPPLTQSPTETAVQLPSSYKS